LLYCKAAGKPALGFALATLKHKWVKEIITMANQKIVELLKRYVVLLNSEGISVSRAYLFGSYATGTATEQSDIDLMIVSDKYDENDDAAIGKAWRLTRNISTRIEPYLISTKKFYNDSTSPLISTIKANGIEIA